jgi:hypothetical protein
MASFLVRSLGLPATRRDYFADDAGRAAESDINRLAASGITAGCASGRFCPTAVVTRAQMASFLSRALALPATSRDYFSDDEGSAHEGDINRLAASSIARGCADGRFCPAAGVRREQMAAFLYRALALRATMASLDLTPNTGHGTGESPTTTPSPTSPPSPTPSVSPTPSPTVSAGPTPDVTASPTPTPSPSISLPSESPTPSPTPSATLSPEPARP